MAKRKAVQKSRNVTKTRRNAQGQTETYVVVETYTDYVTDNSGGGSSYGSDSGGSGSYGE